MVDETVRDEIVVLMRSGDGYFDHDRLSLRHLKNVVPSIGDRLTLHLDDEGLGVYQVEQRYLADLRLVDNGGDDGCFWVLVVDQFHEDHFCELDLTVRAIYREDFHRTWKGAVIPAAPPQYEPVPPPDLPKSKRISHKMKDPAYWTPERKETMRKKREARLARMRAMEELEKKR
ncbi:hypothetical protein HT585_20805 [Ensifer sp. HO-A22]|uniref:Uncharacterized protein n=1 Tax=Ensifer oleiphilus TaxID=2742698 RepID=A0A7Y6Q9L9_9HYPH|nr:hypothetical protein [Ensifer oleiphilus]NVD41320.1 hypothetical protein [Ensifer oleiphilus]